MLHARRDDVVTLSLRILETGFIVVLVLIVLYFAVEIWAALRK